MANGFLDQDDLASPLRIYAAVRTALRAYAHATALQKQVDGLGVVAEREEQAIDAIDALRRLARWDVPAKSETHDTVYDWMQAQPSQDLFIHDKKSNGATAVAATIEQTYRRPYHMHASIGPSTAIATLASAKSTRPSRWTITQSAIGHRFRASTSNSSSFTRAISP